MVSIDDSCHHLPYIYCSLAMLVGEGTTRRSPVLSFRFTSVLSKGSEFVAAMET